MRQQFTFRRRSGPAGSEHGESPFPGRYARFPRGFRDHADFEIPVDFLEPGVIDKVALVGADDMGFAAGELPTDGSNSLNDPVMVIRSLRPQQRRRTSRPGRNDPGAGRRRRRRRGTCGVASLRRQLRKSG